MQLATFNLRQDCRSALEWGLPYSKFSFGGEGDIAGYIYKEIVFYGSTRHKTKCLTEYTSPNENLNTVIPLVVSIFSNIM